MTEIPERLIYYDGKNLHLHNIKTGENITTIPKDFLPPDYDLTDDESSTIFGFDENGLIIVTDHDERTNSVWSTAFVVLKFDIYFKLTKCIRIDERNGRPINILNKTINKSLFNNYSFVDKFYDSKSSFPYGIRISPEEDYSTKRPSLLWAKDDINEICYDRFEGTIVIIFRSTGNCPLIETWKIADNGAQFLRKSKPFGKSWKKNQLGFIRDLKD